MKQLTCSHCGRVLVEVFKGKVEKRPFNLYCRDCEVKEEDFYKQENKTMSGDPVQDMMNMFGMKP